MSHLNSFRLVRVRQLRAAVQSGLFNPDLSVDQVIAQNATVHAQTPDDVALCMSEGVVRRIADLTAQAKVAPAEPEVPSGQTTLVGDEDSQLSADDSAVPDLDLPVVD